MEVGEAGGIAETREAGPGGVAGEKRLLGKAALSRVANLQLHARTVAEGALSGLHRAVHHGASVEFAEHKEYAPGDELRHIDWRAYGRVDKFYVKRYEEETELRGYLVLDASGSMDYAGEGKGAGGGPRPTKFEYARVLAAAIAYLLLRQKDHAGLLAYAEGLARYLPPRGHGAHLADLCETLVGLSPGGPGDLSRTLSYLSEVARRRSLVVVLSDFMPANDPGPGDPSTAADDAAATSIETALALCRSRLSGLRARRHDVVVLHLLDPDELDLPFEGPTWFQDMESPTPGARRLLCDPADVRAAYQKELHRYLDELRRGLRENDIEYHLISTATPYETVLLDLLRGPLRAKRGR